MEDNTANQNKVPQPQPQPEPFQPPVRKKTSKSRLAVPIIAGIVLLTGVGAAAFNANTQNTPEKIWEDALSNTADGFDVVIENANNYDAKGLKVDGSFDLKSPVAADGRIEGSWYDKNALIESSVGLSGIRIDSEIRSITAQGSDTPDIYVYFEGLEVVQGLLGATQPQIGSIIEQVDGQWIAIDRTLINQGLEQIQQETDINVDAVMLSEDDMKDISRVSSEAIKDYLLTADSEKAVFQIAENKGEEEFDGVDTYKYTVTVNKENLKSFVTAYKNALKETQFDEYVTSASEDDQTFEEIIEFDQIIEAIDDIDFTQTANEAWVDLDQRLIRNIRIAPTEQDPGTIGYVEFALPYDGGDILPFTFRINTGREESSGNELVAEFVAGYNQVNSSFALSFDIAGTVDDQDIAITADLNITPSNDEVEVNKPAGATNILEIIGQLQGDLFPSEFMQSSQEFDQLNFDDIEL